MRVWRVRDGRRAGGVAARSESCTPAPRAPVYAAGSSVRLRSAAGPQAGEAGGRRRAMHGQLPVRCADRGWGDGAGAGVHRHAGLGREPARA